MLLHHLSNILSGIFRLFKTFLSYKKYCNEYHGLYIFEYIFDDFLCLDFDGLKI